MSMTVAWRRSSVRSLVRLAFACALVAGPTTIAHAQAWSRHPPLCKSVYPEHQATLSDTGLSDRWNHPVTVVCPIPDTNVRPDSQISEVRLYARDFEWRLLSARACRTSRTGLSTECGPWVESWVDPDFYGDHELTIYPGSIWQSTDFGYLEVLLPAADTLSQTLFVSGYVLVY